jgi:hydrogenase expression/formation protein HypC
MCSSSSQGCSILGWCHECGVMGVDEQCRDDLCITCSDQAVPVTVLRLLDDGLAVVCAGMAGGRPVEEEISVALVEAELGDTVLVHAGEAIAVLRGER